MKFVIYVLFIVLFIVGCGENIAEVNDSNIKLNVSNPELSDDFNESVPILENITNNISNTTNESFENQKVIVVEDPIDRKIINDYFEPFSNKITYIVADWNNRYIREAGVLLMEYYGDNKHIRVQLEDDMVLSKYYGKNIILLGNPCNNQFIEELLETSNCEPYGKDRGFLKHLDLEGGLVLFMISGNDDDTKKLVEMAFDNNDYYSTLGSQVILVSLEDLVVKK